jgi:acyl carrier protein
MEMTSNRKIIREFVVTNYLLGDETHVFTDDESFLESGIMDSTGILELIEFVEETYNLKIEDAELLPENLDSVDNICDFVMKKRGVHKTA